MAYTLHGFCTRVALLLLAYIFRLVTGDFNVVSYGAKGDGQTDSTGAFFSAWTDACDSTKPATLTVPQGRFLLKGIVFPGPCKSKISVSISGTLLASTNYASYTSGQWLRFNGVDGITVSGGTIDGQGGGLWSCKNAGRNCPGGARSLTFSNSKNVVVNGVRLINSQFFHMSINGCQNVNIRGVQTVAPDNSPNTDGIHLQKSSGITVLDSSFRTGDDCISIGPGVSNMWMERINCGPGHGISIGSLGEEANEGPVNNITVKNAVFTGSDNGVRIKTYARPIAGSVSQVLFQDIVMMNTQNPIIINQRYCDGSCPNQQSGVKISGVVYRNVTGTSASQVAVKLDCSSSNPCKAITLQDVRLRYMNQRAQSLCVNAGGTARGVVDPPSCLK